MVAVGMALIWAGYATGLWGWCLLKDYDLTAGQLMSPFHPYGSAKGQPWPPAKIPDTQIWPGAAPAASSGGGPASGGCPDGSKPDQKTGRCGDGSIPKVAPGVVRA